jgi:hypothetical protein
MARNNGTNNGCHPRLREVNDRMRDLARSRPGEERREFICECGDLGCTQLVALSLAEYDARRTGGGSPILAH